ncbi:uncharacterized protein BX664DRAFT_339457 [Halteromyces radiatus]|uniref:uncharacterized protein n=1 Tax=Halteromyces radiatus TaxID=101107 RepID=UPI002220ACDE|nr:uncharacterized protein BX664DRAFT_339457 [Halteromyces radiatus]KAI8082945.1 hypothetical protein BX664DRAFT_339457 [Halteromyces radiatus]
METVYLEAKFSEAQENLRDAKTTILLQKTQIKNCEKLIHKQNNKIQILRQFIVKYHGKQALEDLEDQCQSQFTYSNDTNSRQKRPTCTTSVTIARHPKKRSGTSDLRSFFKSKSSSQYHKSEKPPPSLWETITSPLHSEQLQQNNNSNNMNGLSSSQSTTDSQSSQSSQASETTETSQSSLLDDTLTLQNSSTIGLPASANMSTILLSPKKSSSGTATVISSSLVPSLSRKAKIQLQHASNTKQRTHHSTPCRKTGKRRVNTDTLWKTVTSPTIDLTHNMETSSNTPRKKSFDVHHDLFPTCSSSTKQLDRYQRQKETFISFNKYQMRLQQSNNRSILNSIDQNQPSTEIIENDTNKKEDHFLSRPAPNSEFPYADVVRKRDERSKLHGSTCSCCEKYFANGNTADDRIQLYSRHREKYKQPATPPGYWDLDFPDSPQK